MDDLSTLQKQEKEIEIKEVTTKGGERFRIHRINGRAFFEPMNLRAMIAMWRRKKVEPAAYVLDEITHGYFLKRIR